MRGLPIVDDATYARIVQLSQEYGLPVSTIAERLGLGQRTIRYYLKAWRTHTMPYHPERSDPRWSTPGGVE